MTETNKRVKITHYYDRSSKIHLKECRGNRSWIVMDEVHMTIDEIVKNFREYADDGAYKVHPCAKKFFPKDYLDGRKPNGTINYCV